MTIITFACVNISMKVHLSETPAPQAQHPLLLVVLVQRVLQQLVSLPLVFQVLSALLVQCFPTCTHRLIHPWTEKICKDNQEDHDIKRACAMPSDEDLIVQV